jgi:hypothetical protein
MRLLLLMVSAASLAANEAWAQVAPMPGSGIRRAGMGVGDKTANSGGRPNVRGTASGVGQSYGSYLGHNNTAFGRTIISAPAAATTLGQPSAFQGGGAQPATFQGNGMQQPRSAAQPEYGGLTRQGFGGFSRSAANGLGNVNVQTRQTIQTPAPVQMAQPAQISTPVQSRQPSQPAAPFNVPSTFNGFSRRSL